MLPPLRFRTYAALLLLVATRAALAADAGLLSAMVDRSPVDVLLTADEKFLVTLNQTSSTATLLAWPSGTRLDEVAVGKHPVAIAQIPGTSELLVSGHHDGSLTQLRIEAGKLALVRTLDLGMQPHGIAITADGGLAYVAQTAAAKIAIVDLAAGKIVGQIESGRWPRAVALSSDGARLAVASSGDRGMSIIDPVSKTLLQKTSFFGLNIGHLQIDKQNEYVYFPWMIYRNNPISVNNIKLGWILASRIGRIKIDGASARETFSLDPPGLAIADVHGLALTPDEKHLVVSASGTHELLIYKNEGLPFKEHGGTDHVDPELAKDRSRFVRIELGGRPMGLRITADGKGAIVANYFKNSLQIVDLENRELAREIDLGPAPEPSLERRGEAIFYDARRSLDQWYSCHTCHYEGGINSVTMDTLNDGSGGTYKTVLSLEHLHETGPWTWHGWQTDLRSAMQKSLTETMQGSSGSAADVDAMLAFFKQLKLPPNPFREKDGTLSAAAQRGEQVFHSRAAACATCHSGPAFTDGKTHDVGLGSNKDRYSEFNTPTLRGVYQRVKLLHTGKASTLEEVLTGAHAPSQVAGERDLTQQELADIVEYLKSL